MVWQLQSPASGRAVLFGAANPRTPRTGADERETIMTNETTRRVPQEFWVDAAGALASATDLSPAFQVDANPSDRRSLLLAALAMRLDLRSAAPGSVGARLGRLSVLEDLATAYAADSRDDRLSDLAGDLAAGRRGLAARAAARIRFYRRSARTARRRRALALRPLADLVSGLGGVS